MNIKHLSWAWMAFLGSIALTSCSNDDNAAEPQPAEPKPAYELRVLTFEDEDYKGGENLVGKKDWSSLIDAPQYGGDLLYESEDEEYYWSDENNTFLAFQNIYYPYYLGGHAISNYVSTDITKAGFMQQLEVPTKGGHNGSKNFCVHYGNSAGYLGPQGVPFLYFMDGVERVIDHLFVTNTSYALNNMQNGDGYSTPLPADGFFKVIFTGLNSDGEETGQVEFYLAKDGKAVSDWEKVDLTSLGKVAALRFDVDGSDKGDWGLNTPAYVAYDDVAVQFAN